MPSLDHETARAIANEGCAHILGLDPTAEGHQQEVFDTCYAMVCLAADKAAELTVEQVAEQAAEAAVATVEAELKRHCWKLDRLMPGCEN